MSNDTRFWIERGVTVLIFVVGVSAMFRMVGAAWQQPLNTGKLVFWAAIFFICIVAGVTQYIRFRVAKERRWETPLAKDQASIEVEILAAHAKEQYEAKKLERKSHDTNRT